MQNPCTLYFVGALSSILMLVISLDQHVLYEKKTHVKDTVVCILVHTAYFPKSEETIHTAKRIIPHQNG